MFHARAGIRLTFSAAGLAMAVAGCAPQQNAPLVTAPPASQLSSPAPGAAAPAARGTTMQGHSMGGMNMQQMMAHCAQMRAQARSGAALAPEMQSMMAHCDQMDRMHGQPASSLRQ